MLCALDNNPGITTYILCGLNVCIWIYILVSNTLDKIKEEEKYKQNVNK